MCHSTEWLHLCNYHGANVWDCSRCGRHIFFKCPQSFGTNIITPTITKGLDMKEKKKTALKVKKVMKEFSKGDLHSGSKKGPVVTNPKQAVAIGYSEARKKGRK